MLKKKKRKAIKSLKMMINLRNYNNLLKNCKKKIKNYKTNNLIKC